MGHSRPADPSALIPDDSLCEKWSKPEPNAHGVMIRTCKCGRAQIVRPSTSNLVVPVLDGQFLPGCWRLGDAKDMIDAAARGDALPVSKQPFRPPTTYRRVDPELAKASWDKTVEEVRAHLSGETATAQNEAREAALATMGLARDADPALIKKTWQKFMAQNHPDKFPGDEAVEARWKEMKKAYETLS